MPLPRIPAKPLTAELPSFSPRLVGDLLSTWMEIWAIYYLSIVFYCEIIKPMLLMNARKNLFNVISIVKTLVGVLWQRGIPIRLYVKEEWWWWWNRVPSASWYWVAVSAPSRLSCGHQPSAHCLHLSDKHIVLPMLEQCKLPHYFHSHHPLCFLFFVMSAKVIGG